MISDELFEASERIKDMLANPVYAPFYDAEMRLRIMSVVAQMDALREELDSPRPGEPFPPMPR